MELDKLNVKHFIIFRGDWDVIAKILDYKGGGRVNKSWNKGCLLYLLRQQSKASHGVSVFTLRWRNLKTHPQLYTVGPTVHSNPSRKCSFISTVRPTVNTDLSRKRSFPKTLFKPEEFENVDFVFYCGPKRNLPKRWPHGNDVISLPEFSSKGKSKMTG